MTTITKAYCPGSGKVIPKKGYKTKNVRYAVKYQCPDCGGYFAMKQNRTLNAHGYTLRLDDGTAVKNGIVSTCAECGDHIIGVDYLCEKCREAS